MLLFKKITDLRQWLNQQRKHSKKTGFVPTMGALHKGHISLIDAAKKVNDITVCSIFVNPTQFNNAADFDKYPITIETDIVKLEQAGCDVLFLPDVAEIYPNGPDFNKKYELGDLETILEGKFRPGHYQGVCMVVERLLNIVMPDNLYLGQKDFQQCMVITKLLELMNVNNIIAITICPTLREEDGLAMSSRNMRLTDDERTRAPMIYQALNYISKERNNNNPSILKQEAAKMLEEAGFKVDYVEIAEQASLNPLTNWTDSERAIALVAAYNNEVRLIDNMLL